MCTPPPRGALPCAAAAAAPHAGGGGDDDDGGGVTRWVLVPVAPDGDEQLLAGDKRLPVPLSADAATVLGRSRLTQARAACVPLCAFPPLSRPRFDSRLMCVVRARAPLALRGLCPRVAQIVDPTVHKEHAAVALLPAAACDVARDVALVDALKAPLFIARAAGLVGDADAAAAVPSPPPQHAHPRRRSGAAATPLLRVAPGSRLMLREGDVLLLQPARHAYALRRAPAAAAPAHAAGVEAAAAPPPPPLPPPQGGDVAGGGAAAAGWWSGDAGDDDDGGAEAAAAQPTAKRRKGSAPKRRG
jgi:hypothetical protein